MRLINDKDQNSNMRMDSLRPRENLQINRIKESNCEYLLEATPDISEFDLFQDENEDPNIQILSPKHID